MNQKRLIQLILGVAVALVGAWQMQGKQGSSEAPTRSSQQQNRNHQGQTQNEPRAGGQAGSQSGNQSGNPRSTQAGDFDYYLISLSWSPAYCVDHPNDKRQCGGRGFGFVLHGLWPQKSTGGYPENCAAGAKPSAVAVNRALAFMPSEKLIQHEWSKHGTCTGLSGDEYLALADRAYAAVRIPAGFEAPTSSRTVPANQILSEFKAANPQMPGDSITLRCSGGELEEVRVCVDMQLRPAACGKGVRTQCGRDQVLVRAVR